MIASETLITQLSVMSMTVALIGAVMSLTQRQDRAMFRVLALFFFALAVTEFGDALTSSLIHEPLVIALNAVWIVGAASVVPLLWLYIWKLTEDARAWPKRIWPHAAIPVLAAIIFCAIYALSEQDRRFLFTDADGEISTRAYFVGFAYQLCAIVIVVFQWFAYLLIISKRLLKYRKRLKDVFASTEGKELRWVAVVIGICGAYWLLGFVLLMLEIFGIVGNPPELPEYILNLAVGAILLIWGLRQRRSPLQESDKPKSVDYPKYANSALTPEMATRIATKLKRAMTEAELHLDPNLSLWSLSKHVGVSDNYVSQVLNEEIGQNFFDFVNSYRVSNAQERLKSSDETILNIAYDTGFNSRSSFYTAFKKCTGQTPTAFRSGTVRTD